MNDRFYKNSDPTQVARNGYEAVPSNTTPLPTGTRQLRILADGDLEVVFTGYPDEPTPTVADNKVLILGVVKGETFEWAVSHITEGTTAEVLVVY